MDEFLSSDENIDIILGRYNLLNEINLPNNIKKFPYNIMNTHIIITYKTINLEMKNKSFYTTINIKTVDKKYNNKSKHGGAGPIIIYGI